MSRCCWWVFASMLLFPHLAWAEPTGVQLYEEGEYAAAVMAFEAELANPQQSTEARELTLIHLAAALHAVSRVEAAIKYLELLALEYPNARVDPVRFLPELVTIAEAIRNQVKAKQDFEASTREIDRLMQEEAQRRPPPPPPTHWRPEAFALYEAVDTGWTVGVGLGYQWRELEGTARVLLGDAVALQLQGGVLLRERDLMPLVGVRASFLPSLVSYGAGPVVGVRYALPAHLVALVDVGAEYFFVGRDDRYSFALTVQAGLGFDVRVP